MVPLLPPEHNGPPSQNQSQPMLQSRSQPRPQSQIQLRPRMYDPTEMVVRLPPMSSVSRRVPHSIRIEQVSEEDQGGGVGPSIVPYSARTSRSRVSTGRHLIVQPPMNLEPVVDNFPPSRKEDKKGLWNRFGKKLKRTFTKKPSSSSSESKSKSKGVQKSSGSAMTTNIASGLPTITVTRPTTTTQQLVHQNSSRGEGEEGADGARGRGKVRMRGGSSALHYDILRQRHSSMPIVPQRVSSLHAYSTNDGYGGSTIELLPYEKSPPLLHPPLNGNPIDNYTATLSSAVSASHPRFPLTDTITTTTTTTTTTTSTNTCGNGPRTRSTTIARTTNPAITIRLVHTPSEQSVENSLRSSRSSEEARYNSSTQVLEDLEEDQEDDALVEQQLQQVQQRYRAGFGPGASRADIWADFDSVSERLEGLVEEEEREEEEQAHDEDDGTDEDQPDSDEGSTDEEDHDSSGRKDGKGGPGDDNNDGHGANSNTYDASQDSDEDDVHDRYDYSPALHSAHGPNFGSQPASNTYAPSPFEEDFGEPVALDSADPAIIYTPTNATTASFDAPNVNLQTPNPKAHQPQHPTQVQAHNHSQMHHSQSLSTTQRHELVPWIDHLLTLNATYRDNLSTLHTQLCYSIHQLLIDHTRGVHQLREDILSITFAGAQGGTSRTKLTNAYLSDLISEKLHGRINRDLMDQDRLYWLLGKVLRQGLRKTMLTYDYEEDEFEGTRVEPSDSAASPAGGEGGGGQGLLSQMDEQWSLFKWNFSQKPYATLRDLNEARCAREALFAALHQEDEQNQGEENQSITSEVEESYSIESQDESADNLRAQYLEDSLELQGNNLEPKREPDEGVVWNNSDWNRDNDIVAPATVLTAAAINPINLTESLSQESVSQGGLFGHDGNEAQSLPRRSPHKDTELPSSSSPPLSSPVSDSESSTSPHPVVTEFAANARCFYMQDPSHCQKQSLADPCSRHLPVTSTAPPPPPPHEGGVHKTTEHNHDNHAKTGGSTAGPNATNVDWMRGVYTLLHSVAASTAPGTRLPVWLIYAPPIPASTSSTARTGTTPATCPSHVSPNPQKVSEDSSPEAREDNSGTGATHGRRAKGIVINNCFKGGTHYHYYKPVNRGGSAESFNSEVSFRVSSPSSSGGDDGGDSPFPSGSSSPMPQQRKPSEALESLFQVQQQHRSQQYQHHYHYQNQNHHHHHHDLHPNTRSHEPSSNAKTDQRHEQEEQQQEEEQDLWVFSPPSSPCSDSFMQQYQQPPSPLHTFPPLPPPIISFSAPLLFENAPGYRTSQGAFSTTPTEWNSFSESTGLNGRIVSTGSIGAYIQTSAQALPAYQMYPWGHPVWRYDGSVTNNINNSSNDASNSLDASWPLELQQPFIRRTPSRFSVVDHSSLQTVAGSQQQEQTKQQPQTVYPLYKFTYDNNSSPSSSKQGNLNTTNNIVSSATNLSRIAAPEITIPPPHLDASPSTDEEVAAVVDAIIANSEKLYMQKKEVRAQETEYDSLPKNYSSISSSSNSSDIGGNSDSSVSTSASTLAQYDRKEDVLLSEIELEDQRARAMYQRAMRRRGHAFVSHKS
ncbi:hypothetical protein EC991_010702 [Linnemannia zychae]|nr:hypothetical protein EC991_010702 [Linnemannia zychae]